VAIKVALLGSYRIKNAAPKDHTIYALKMQALNIIKVRFCLGHNYPQGQNE
jgi:hypothetical protein